MTCEEESSSTEQEITSRPGESAALPDAPEPALRRGLIINQAADALVGYLPLPGPLTRDTPPSAVTAGFHKIVDQYAGTQVSHIFFNTNYQRTAYPSDVWQSFWDVPDPERDTSGWPRLTWLVHETGVDLYAVCIRRCREQGISPWLSLRMNDTHYHDDPTKISSLWWDHPEWRLLGDPHNGFDYNVSEVRDHYRALIVELLGRYDADGLELDWMRFPWHFKRGEEDVGREELTQFMRDVRGLANQAAERRGHPVRIAVRVPAVPEFAYAMGMDGAAWVRDGLVDILIPASVWRPSDTDQPIEEWRQRIGPVEHDFSLAAGTDLWLQGAPDGLLMMNNLESMRGFSAAMLDRGADQIYLFNHFNENTFSRTCETPDGGTVLRNDYQDLLCQAARLDTVLDKPRRHVVTWHDPAPAAAPNPIPLPATATRERPAIVRVCTGPKPAGGRAVIRAGLEQASEARDVALAARLNGAECRPIADLKPESPSGLEGEAVKPVVKTVAEVAPQVAQFEAPLAALRRGHNTVEISLKGPGARTIVWLEIHLAPQCRPE